MKPKTVLLFAGVAAVVWYLKQQDEKAREAAADNISSVMAGRL